MNLNQLDFALVTSDSLPKRIMSWDSYEALSEDQFIDLIDYSKELMGQDPNHEILFLVVAKGNDEKENEEELKMKKLEEELAEAEKLKEVQNTKNNELRERSKKILNSLYGV